MERITLPNRPELALEFEPDNQADYAVLYTRFT
jgi:hypothetical protein